jgi:hypothetical protein
MYENKRIYELIDECEKLRKTIMDNPPRTEEEAVVKDQLVLMMVEQCCEAALLVQDELKRRYSNLRTGLPPTQPKNDNLEK